MQHTQLEQYSQNIKDEAKRLGFLACGISKASFLEEEAPRLERWLRAGMHGTMRYMERHFDKRLDPRLLVEGAQSVVSVLLNYFPSEHPEHSEVKISKYAYGTDYHQVLKHKLKALLQFIQTEIGEVNGRAFVDSAPVLDKAWAAKSGLGWVGKNGNLITQKTGSFYFIGELIIDLPLAVDGPTTDHCGSCTACLDACPTHAIIQPFVVDGSRCISYYTIELKEQLQQRADFTLDGWMFGCDVCQDVCPWNRFAKPHREPAFEINESLRKFSTKDWEEITEDVFQEKFRDSPLQRKGWQGLQDTLRLLKKERSR